MGKGGRHSPPYSQHLNKTNDWFLYEMQQWAEGQFSYIFPKIFIGEKGMWSKVFPLFYALDLIVDLQFYWRKVSYTGGFL